MLAWNPDVMAESKSQKQATVMTLNISCLCSWAPRGPCWCWLLPSFQRGFSFLWGNKPGPFSPLQGRTIMEGLIWPFFSLLLLFPTQGLFNPLPVSLAWSSVSNTFKFCFVLSGWMPRAISRIIFNKSVSTCSWFLLIPLVFADMKYLNLRGLITKNTTQKNREKQRRKVHHPKVLLAFFSNFFLHLSPDMRWSRGFSLQICLFGCQPSAESGPVLALHLQTYLHKREKVSTFISALSLFLFTFSDITRLHFSLRQPTPLSFSSQCLFFCETWHQEKDERLLMFPWSATE